MRTAYRLAVLLATATVPAAVLLAVRLSAQSPPLGEIVTRPVLVGTVALSTTSPGPGDTVLATVTIRADRSLRLQGITVAVRDERGRAVDAAGSSYDFPDYGPVKLDTRQKTLTSSQQYHERGTYVYFLQYRTDGRWHPLAPYSSFTVG